jgi:hypothetical protein
MNPYGALQSVFAGRYVRTYCIYNQGPNPTQSYLSLDQNIELSSALIAEALKMLT